MVRERGSAKLGSGGSGGSDPAGLKDMRFGQAVEKWRGLTSKLFDLEARMQTQASATEQQQQKVSRMKQQQEQQRREQERQERAERELRERELRERERAAAAASAQAERAEAREQASAARDARAKELQAAAKAREKEQLVAAKAREREQQVAAKAQEQAAARDAKAREKEQIMAAKAREQAAKKAAEAAAARQLAREEQVLKRMEERLGGLEKELSSTSRSANTLMGLLGRVVSTVTGEGGCGRVGRKEGKITVDQHR